MRVGQILKGRYAIAKLSASLVYFNCSKMHLLTFFVVGKFRVNEDGPEMARPNGMRDTNVN